LIYALKVSRDFESLHAAKFDPKDGSKIC